MTAMTTVSDMKTTNYRDFSDIRSKSQSEENKNLRFIGKSIDIN